MNSRRLCLGKQLIWFRLLCFCYCSWYFFAANWSINLWVRVSIIIFDRMRINRRNTPCAVCSQSAFYSNGCSLVLTMRSHKSFIPIYAFAFISLSLFVAECNTQTHSLVCYCGHVWLGPLNVRLNDIIRILFHTFMYLCIICSRWSNNSKVRTHTLLLNAVCSGLGYAIFITVLWFHEMTFYGWVIDY